MNMLERRRGMMELEEVDLHDYLTFTSTMNGQGVGIWESGTPPTLNLEYKLNRQKWKPYVYGVYIDLNAGSSVKFRNADATVATQFSSSSGNKRKFYFKQTNSGTMIASGNIMSLLDKECLSTTIGAYCFVDIFNGKKALATLPELPFTTIGEGALYGAFCRTDITEARLYVTSFGGSQAMYYTFGECKSVTSYHVASLNNSGSVFAQNTACEEFIIDAATPPTIIANTISGLKADCIIYVPDNSVNDYKAANYWNARSSYIKGISERTT